MSLSAGKKSRASRERLAYSDGVSFPIMSRNAGMRAAGIQKKKVLFPGYVFLISDDVEQLFFALKNVQGLTKIIGTGREVVPLTDSEVLLLQKLGGDDQIVETSIGTMEQDQILITRGPLKGLEGYIKKIDRHKRTAWLELEMMGRTIEAKVGLEVVEKR